MGCGCGRKKQDNRSATITRKPSKTRLSRIKPRRPDKKST